MPVKVFFCYAHEDEALLNILKAHLKPLQRRGLIDVWHDRDINAGTEWEQEISKHLNEADIILLLVSPDFMNSDYCYGIEMQRAIERHNSGDACVIPVILRYVSWRGEPLGKLQALPTDGKPVKSQNWYDLDEAFFDIAEGIQKVVEEKTVPSPATLLDATMRQMPTGQQHQRESRAQEVDAEALAMLREEMQRRIEADRLLLEADKFAPDIFERERLIKQAVELCPDYKAKRNRQLGIEMSAAVLDGYDPIRQIGSRVAGLGRGMVGYVSLERDDIEKLTTSAVSYLRENVLDTTPPDGEGLLYLACMYGYQQQFEEMMNIITKAVQIDREITEEFQERKILLTLLRACGSDPMKLEQLRERLGIPPTSKLSFCNFIQDFDYADFNGYIYWLAIKRPNAAGEKGTFLIMITPPYVQYKGLVSASAQNVESWQNETVADGYFLNISELYDALDTSFVLICPPSESSRRSNTLQAKTS